MNRRAKNEDFNYTARLGVWCFLALFFLLFLGDTKEVEPRELVSPVPIIKAEEISAEALPTPTPTLSEKEKIVQEIESVFGEQAGLAKKVAFCESSMIASKKSRHSTAKGLFQIIDGTWERFDCQGNPLNYQENIACAKKIYDYYGSFATKGGWKASQKCWEK